MTSNAVDVVATYEARSRFARAETAAVPSPHRLLGLLNGDMHVAEIPCGAGHFLADYLHAGTAVTLVDASPAMLATAVEHATEIGMDAARTFPVLSYMEDLPPLQDVDLAVIPNAALNQLACRTPLTDLLASLRKSLPTGASVLAQAACTHPLHEVDTATFYCPNLPHQTWFTDRRFNPHASGAATRRRRQRRGRDRLWIEFDYREATGVSLHTTEVELALFSPTQLIAAFHATGFTRVRVRPGHSRLSEISACTSGAP